MTPSHILLRIVANSLQLRHLNWACTGLSKSILQCLQNYSIVYCPEYTDNLPVQRESQKYSHLWWLPLLCAHLLFPLLLNFKKNAISNVDNEGLPTFTTGKKTSESFVSSWLIFGVSLALSFVCFEPFCDIIIKLIDCTPQEQMVSM